MKRIVESQNLRSGDLIKMFIPKDHAVARGDWRVTPSPFLEDYEISGMVLTITKTISAMYVLQILIDNRIIRKTLCSHTDVELLST